MIGRPWYLEGESLSEGHREALDDLPRIGGRDVQPQHPALPRATHHHLG